MRNNFPGVCYRCGKPVKAKEGHFQIIPRQQRVNGVKWKLQHATCAIYYRNLKHENTKSS